MIREPRRNTPLGADEKVPYGAVFGVPRRLAIGVAIGVAVGVAVAVGVVSSPRVRGSGLGVEPSESATPGTGRLPVPPSPPTSSARPAGAVNGQYRPYRPAKSCHRRLLPRLSRATWWGLVSTGIHR